MGQRLTLAVQGKMDVVKINGYDDDDDDISEIYLRFISDISRNIWDIYLGYIWNISGIYLKYIRAMYIGYILDISLICLEYIQGYIRNISGIY